MIKSLKWKSSTPGNASSQREEEEYDHPNMTVEFPSPLNTEDDDLINNNNNVVGGHSGHHSAGDDEVDKALSLFHHQDTASPSPSSSATSDEHHNNTNGGTSSSLTNGSPSNQQQQQQKQEQGYAQFLNYLESDNHNDTSYRSGNSAVNTSIDIINEEEEEVRASSPKFIQTKTLQGCPEL